MKRVMSPLDLREGIASGRLSRRDVTKVLAAAGIATVTTHGVARRAEAQDTWLQVFTWSGYDVPELHPQFVEKYGKSPDFALFADNDEAIQKITAGFQADIAVPTAYMAGKWYDAGLLAPVDTGRLANWGDVFDKLKNLEGTQFDGQQYVLPWAWGNSSIIYRTDLAADYVGNESWSILFDEKYKGRIGARDAMDGVIVPAALILGFDPYNMNDDQIAQVREMTIKARDVARFFWSDQSEIEQALASGEIVAAYAWNDAYKRLKEAGVPVAYMVPKEGILTWTDGQVLLKGGQANADVTYDYLDSTLSAEVGKFMIESYGYGSCNRKAFEIADQALVASLGLNNPENVMTSGIFFQGMEGGYRDRLIKMFEEVKAGA